MNLFKQTEKEAIIKEFNERHGIYSRLYLEGNIGNIADAIMFRCESKVIPNTVYVTVYERKFTYDKIEKYDYQNDLLIGMKKIMSKDKQVVKLKNTECFIVKQQAYYPKFDQIVFEYDTNKTDKVIQQFIKRIQKYYKEDKNVILFFDYNYEKEYREDY